MRNVAILIPTYDSKVQCQLMISMAEIFRINAERGGMQLFIHCWMGEAILEKARNNLFYEAYSAGYDDIVFLDSDQSFEPAAFFKMLEHPVDVLALPVRMKTEEARFNLRPENPKEHEFDPKPGLLKVQRAGTGMLRISRKAMEAIYNDSPEYFDGVHTRRRVFEVKMINGNLFSEDVVFCDHLTELGFPTYVDINYTVKHYGTKCFEGDYKEHFKQHFLA